MLSAAAFDVYRQGIRNVALLWPLPLLLALSLPFGVPEGATVIIKTPLALLFLLLALIPLTFYVYRQALLLEEITGHAIRGNPVQIYTSFLLLSLALLVLHVVGFGPLGIFLLTLPAAVSVDGIRGMRDFVLGWRLVPLVELIFIVTALLLTSYALEVFLPLGFLLSATLTIIFTIPYTLTYLLVLYITRYPIARRSLVT